MKDNLCRMSFKLWGLSIDSLHFSLKRIALLFFRLLLHLLLPDWCCNCHYCLKSVPQTSTSSIVIHLKSFLLQRVFFKKRKIFLNFWSASIDSYALPNLQKLIFSPLSFICVRFVREKKNLHISKVIRSHPCTLEMDAWFYFLGRQCEKWIWRACPGYLTVWLK